MSPVSRPLRRATAALLVSILAVVGVWTPGPLALDPAEAADGSSVVVTGRGWGHGRGLGQWGARGYASGHATGTPWNSDQILDHFYGGTVKGSVPNTNISVWLKTLDNKDVRIFTKGGGFKVGDLVVPPGNAVRIANVGGQWRAFQALSCTGVEDMGTPVADNSALALGSANDKNNLLHVCDGGAGKPYRGFLTAVEAEGARRVVNTVGLEDYLQGVVPAEMPSSWEPAALQSQAVAARSYALAQGGQNGKRYSWAKTCDDIFCQVYNGANAEVASTNAAIAATAFQVRRDSASGVIESTEFSASTGGWTTGSAFTNVEDKGDSHPSNPHRSWSVTLDPAAIAAKYGLGTLEGISVTKRNGLGADGGRVTEMKLDGTTKDATISGNTFRSDMGLKSDWFTVSRGGITFQRVQGADRFATAAAVARTTFASSEVAIIARGDGTNSFADGLAANFLGGVLSAPTLLTNAGSLPQITSDTLSALGVKTVKVLGGPSAVSDAVLAKLDETYDVQRIWGANRFGTAGEVARAGGASIGSFGGKKTAVLSSGWAFPDALAAGGIVFAMRFPQLLTDSATLSPETKAALTDLGIQHVIITGGEAAVSAGVKQAVEALGITTERPHGSDRFQTAAVLADLAISRYGFTAGHVDVPTGESFPDALTAGSHAGRGRAPIVLGTKLGVANATCAYLRNRAGALNGGHIFGGPAAIDDSAKAALEGCTRS